MAEMGVTRCGDTQFRWGERTYVMGIINLSPDSFSGDGVAGLGEAAAQASPGWGRRRRRRTASSPRVPISWTSVASPPAPASSR